MDNNKRRKEENEELRFARVLERYPQETQVKDCRIAESKCPGVQSSSTHTMRPEPSFFSFARFT